MRFIEGYIAHHTIYSIEKTAHVAKDGAEVARNARADIEQRLRHSVISNQKAIDHITPQDELPFKKEE